MDYCFDNLLVLSPIWFRLARAVSVRELYLYASQYPQAFTVCPYYTHVRHNLGPSHKFGGAVSTLYGQRCMSSVRCFLGLLPDIFSSTSLQSFVMNSRLIHIFIYLFFCNIWLFFSSKISSVEFVSVNRRTTFFIYLCLYNFAHTQFLKHFSIGFIVYYPFQIL